MPSGKRVGYIGWLGYENLGDEAMYVAFEMLFSKIDTILFKSTEKMEIFEKIMRRKIYKAVILGGGTLINTPGSLEEFETALAKYRPVFVFGTGVQNPSFWDSRRGNNGRLQAWIESLRKCEYVGVRGPLSKQVLFDNGFDGAEIVGDLALFLAREKIVRKKKSKKVAFNIGASGGNVWGSEEGVLDFSVQCVKALLYQGWDVVFVPVWEADMPYIDEARKRIGKPVEVFSQYTSIEKAMDFLESCDVCIGEKLHSVILAMCVFTPSIMLEYRPKCRDFMMSMDLEKFTIRTDQLNVETTIDLLNELYENMDFYQEKISQKTQHYRTIQKEKSDMITRAIVER